MANATTANPPMMGAAPVDTDRIEPRRVVAFIIMVFGMFMSILDIQIVSASLSDIQAGLSASSTEVSWVQTAYLIAEVIAIPLSGFLSRALGTRLLFAISAAGFTFASLLCGFASSSEEMILWRAIQGFLGAGMIPTVFASAYTVFPRSKFYIVGPIIGLVATLAPTIGPTVGGLITDLMSWHWLFFINVIPGIIITVGVLALVDFDQPNFALLQRFDWWGLIFMAGFLGALEYVLEEGPQYEWLQDTSVAICAVVSLLSAIGFFWRVFTAKVPIVDLRTFSDRNFAVGCLLQLCSGIGLYGLTYVYPRYLAEVRGYSAMMIGETMFVSGATQFLMAPIIGRLMQRFDLRYIIVFGLVIFAAGSYQMTGITRDYDFYELLIPQILRGIGLMCVMVPTNNIALGTLAPERVKNALGPVQPDAQSRRRDRACPHQRGLERAHRPAHRPPAGPRHLGQFHGGRDPEQFHPAYAGHGRRRDDGDEAAVAARASPGPGDEFRRRVLHHRGVLSGACRDGAVARQAEHGTGRRGRALDRRHQGRAIVRAVCDLLISRHDKRSKPAMTETLRKGSGASLFSTIWSDGRDPAGRIRNVDRLAVPIAVLLPWTTTGVVDRRQGSGAARIGAFDCRSACDFLASLLRRPGERAAVGLFRAGAVGDAVVACAVE